MEIRKKEWVTLCTSEWPTLGVGWPKDGTFNLDLISQIKDQVCRKGDGGRPGQVPYIMVWEDLTRKPPLWVKPFITPGAIKDHQQKAKEGVDESSGLHPSPPLTPSTPVPAETPAQGPPPTSGLYPLKELQSLKSACPPVLSDGQEDLLFMDPPTAI